MKPALRTSAMTCLVLLLAVTAAACGSSSKSASTTATTTTVKAASTTGGSGPGGTPSTVKASGGGDFCKHAAVDYNNAITNASSMAGGIPTADKFKATIEAELKASQELASQAPDELKSDIATIRSATKPYFDALAAVNYDFTKLGASAMSLRAGMTTPQYKAAVAHLSSYMKNTCGISITTP